MGMDLVPVYEEDMNGDDSNAVQLSSSVINNLGVRTAKVEKNGFRNQIETVGYIDYDETKVSHVHLRAEGWVKKLYVNSVGERVPDQGWPQITCANTFKRLVHIFEMSKFVNFQKPIKFFEPRAGVI